MRWWRWVVLSVALAGVAPATPGAGQSAPRAPASILTDATTGQVLFEQDADASRASGSLNQLMILLLSMEQVELHALSLEAPVTVSPLATRSTGARTRVPLHGDDTYVLSDLLKALSVSSADNVAVAIAEAIGGSIPSCLELMQARAQRQGMTATHYANVGGVTASRAPVTGPARSDSTTARDLARLAQALMRYESVRSWTSLNGLPFDHGATPLRNANQLIGAVPGVDGLEAATSLDAATRTRGYSVVATAQRGALRLIAVVLGARDSAARYAKAAELLEWGFGHYERVAVVQQGERLNVTVRVLNGAVPQLIAIAGQTVSLLRRREEERALQLRYQIPARLQAPVTRHQVIGELIVEDGRQLIAVVPVLAASRVAARSMLSAAQP